ncbi:MAG: hypothetical protein ACLGPL_04735 [Acidobacteriota bacterium]
MAVLTVMGRTEDLVADLEEVARAEGPSEALEVDHMVVDQEVDPSEVPVVGLGVVPVADMVVDLGAVAREEGIRTDSLVGGHGDVFSRDGMRRVLLPAV